MSGPDVSEPDIKFITEALKSGWYGKGAYKYVELFESEFARLHSRKYGLMTPNCTHAIHLLLAALGITKGDSVVVPEITWVATAAPITYVGAEVLIADVEYEDWCISPRAIDQVIRPDTKAVIAVDVYGNMPNYEKLQTYCNERNLFLIEDAAEGLGSTFGNRLAGSFGVGSVFSFHRTKTITTGEGGMLLIDDEDLYQRCKFLRDHGRSPGSFYCEEFAFKYMPSNLLAALGYGQLQRIHELVGKKIKILDFYKEGFSDIPGLRMNPIRHGEINGAWCSVLNWDSSLSIDSGEFNQRLSNKNIPTRPFFHPLSSLPLAKRMENIQKTKNQNHVARELHSSSICLPSALNLTEDNLKKVVKAVRDVIDEVKLMI